MAGYAFGSNPPYGLISLRNDAARLSVLLSEIASEFLPD